MTTTVTARRGITLLDQVQVSPRAARAHGMKNALSVILAVSRLVESELSDQSRSRMDRLRSALWRLHGLLAEDLKDEEGRSAGLAARRLCPVRSIIEQATDRVEDRAAAAHVELFVQCGGGELLCDEGGLTEAMSNLLSNAIDASPAGGGVFLATYETRDGDQYWVVQDTGSGIPAPQLGEIGRPFRSTKVGGSGLGLAVARAAIAAHGGLVRIESSPGAGTIVSVWLPDQRRSEAETLDPERTGLLEQLGADGLESSG
jgi:signal transduction histidine kinase